MRQTGTVYRFIKNKTLTVEVCANANAFMGLFGGGILVFVRRTFAGQMRRISSLSVNKWSYSTSTESEFSILKPPGQIREFKRIHRVPRLDSRHGSLAGYTAAKVLNTPERYRVTCT